MPFDSVTVLPVRARSAGVEKCAQQRIQAGKNVGRDGRDFRPILRILSDRLVREDELGRRLRTVASRVS